MRKQPKGNPFNVEFEKKIYSGTYFVSHGLVTVDSMYGGPVSQHADGRTAEFDARRILREILIGAKTRGEI